MLRPGVRVLAPFVLALTLSCGSPPAAEMSEARRALAEARAAGAEQYAPAEYRQAASAIQRSERSVLDGDNRQALSAALEARDLAGAASASAGRAKEDARGAASAALHQAEASLANARAFVDEATAHPPRTRPERLHVSEVRRAVVVANVALQKAREAMGREDYPAAREAIEGVPARLDEVVSAGSEPPPPPQPQRRR